MRFRGLAWDDNDAKALARVLREGALPKLESLYLDQNQIGDVGVRELAQAAVSGKCPYLMNMVLDGNPASESVKQDAENFLKENQSGL